MSEINSHIDPRARLTLICFAAAILLFYSITSFGQSTEFTYQGSLKDGAALATGNYDLEFRLYDGGGTQLGSAQTRSGVAVAAGIFSVKLDFGSVFPGADRFLEIAVRTAGGGAFTTLNPRQKIDSSPYAVKSLNSATADAATNAVSATTALTAVSFSGGLSGDVTGTQAATTVARLQSRNVSTTAPSGGQVLKYNSTTSQWEPATDETASGGGGGTITGVTAGTGLTGGGASGNVALAIANGGVGTAQLADNNVTDPKINAVSGAKITGAVTNSLQLGGVAANQYVQTDDTRLSDARAPIAGSSNYVQNTTSPQGGSNYNISGTGSANILNAVTQFNIGGGRILSNPGNSNLFAGIDAGLFNTSGPRNSFFGNGAGRANGAGSDNSFFGSGASLLNSSGSENATFGASAGLLSTSGSRNTFIGYGTGSGNSTGSDNTFVGRFSGQANGNGFNNSIFGANADLGSAGLSFATAIGAGTIVTSSNTVAIGRNLDTVQIPGNLNVAGSLTANINGASITNLNASNISTGTLNNARLGIVPVTNGGTGSATQNFVDLTTAQTVAGDKTFSNTLTGNTVNAVTQYNIGGQRVLSVAGIDNLFAGGDAGQANTGSSNVFVGKRAGRLNTDGNQNSFYGISTGQNNLGGSLNSFFGGQAGTSNTTGDGNSFFGRNAGNSNTTGNDNTIIGNNADVGSGNLTFATAIGSGAVVTSSNSIVLGRQNGSDTVRVPGNLSIPTGDLSLQRVFATTYLSVLAGTDAEPGSGGYVVAGSIGSTNVVIDDNEIMARSAGATATLALNADGGNVNLIQGGTGNVGIGTSAPTDKLDVDGDIRVGTTGTNGCIKRADGTGILGSCSSDVRFKQGITSFPNLLDKVSQLRPVHYYWRAAEFPTKHFGSEQSYGLIAQDVERILPELVSEDSHGYKQIDYSKLPLMTIQAVKELKAKTEEQQAQIELLRSMNDALLKRLEKVERSVHNRTKARHR
ncbi:MAG: tail fiber domain-containing protein [Pyrinomonadaceae bacterium]